MTYSRFHLGAVVEVEDEKAELFKMQLDHVREIARLRIKLAKAKSAKGKVDTENKG